MPIQRRQFLCVTSIGAAACAAAHWLRDGPEGELGSVRCTARALGADVSISALHADGRLAQAAVDAAFAELELVESLLSIYRPESQLSQLNRTGVVDRPHPYFVEVLRAAWRMSRRSGGAFDITVQPLWALSAAAQAAGRLPAEEEIQAARALADWRRVQVGPRQIRLASPGMAITLNGIAQGFAADKAAAALQRSGVQQALIDTGEMNALGCKQDGQPWRIGIQHPRQPDAYLSLAQLAGRCLATSGDYATTFSDDFSRHHLFDPRTGRSPAELAAVSVAAPTAMEADALSTALLVLGPVDGLQLIRSTPDAEALLVWKGGRLAATPGFPLQA